MNGSQIDSVEEPIRLLGQSRLQKTHMRLLLVPTGKSSVGWNYARWEDQVQRHFRCLSAKEQPNISMSLLSGEAYGRVSEEDVFRDRDVGESLRIFSRLLDIPAHPIEYRKQLRGRSNGIGKMLALLWLSWGSWHIKTIWRKKTKIWKPGIGIAGSRHISSWG